MGRKQIARWLVLLLVTVLVTVALPGLAQVESPSGNAIDGYPVLLGGKVIFRFKEGIPNAATAEERASIVSQRLAEIANDPDITPNEIRVEEAANTSVVKAEDTVLFTIRDIDAQAMGQPRQTIANDAVQVLQSQIKRYREENSARRLLLGILFTVLSTFTILIFLRVQEQLFFRLLNRIRVAQQSDRLDLRLRHLQLLGSNATGYLLLGSVRLLKLVLVLIAFYLYISFVFQQFPVTRPLGISLLSEVAYRAHQIVLGLANYLPNSITIGLIILITYYAIEFTKLVITELGRDDAYPWFYPEWIQPTVRLATILLVAIACVVASPYLPGFGSPAFQGISIFLGALLSLGASSGVANAISGVILIYTRAFQIGDYIRIGGVDGEVIETSLFVTRLITFKQEVITVPNSTVLSDNVINFNAILRRSGGHLLLHTTITLGYDAPWRKVYDVLIEAAKATPDVLLQPAPFVLQTSLNDYHISYEINAYTDRPNQMPRIYSELHQNIQDYCNQAGIEILSPAFSALRDGNHTTIPAEYLPTDYISPSFKVRDR